MPPGEEGAALLTVTVQSGLLRAGTPGVLECTQRGHTARHQEVSWGDPERVVGALLGAGCSSGDAPLKSILSWGQLGL